MAGVGLLVAILGLVPGLVAGLAHAALYVLVIAPLINGLGHWRGGQNFANTAYNWRVLAWMTGGEGLHNTTTPTRGRRTSVCGAASSIRPGS